MADKDEAKAVPTPGVAETTEEREARIAKESAEAASKSTPRPDGHPGIVKTEGGTVVLFPAGEYGSTPIEQVPSWYLAHLMADAVDHIKWSGLTKEQQEAIKHERDRRANAVPPGAVSPAPPATAAVAAAPGGEAEAKGGAKEPSASVAEMTVADAKELIAKAKTKEELDAIAKAEKARDAGPRVGVTDAIDKRRDELKEEAKKG